MLGKHYTKEHDTIGKYIGTISMDLWNVDSIRSVFEKLDGHELILGRETGKGGFNHYQFCVDCAGDLEEYARSNSLGWHIESAVDWEKSKAYCRKTGNYLYFGDSIEERYYQWIRSKGVLPIWKSFGASCVCQNDRQITVWVDTQGGASKSTWCYLVERRGKCLSVPRTEQNPTRISDYVAMHYDNEPLIVVDIPRDDKITPSLCKALEDIKDGKITSAKYQGTRRFIKGVKILVFTNHWIPKETYAALSEDRWIVRSIKKKAEIDSR